MVKVTKRIRKIFSPIDVSCNIVPKSGDDYCPLIQDYDFISKTYAIDRTSHPTVIMPQVTLTTFDKSVYNIEANNVVGNIVWLAMAKNETEYKDISTISSWSGKYRISYNDDYTKGYITISRNLLSEEMISLKYRAYYFDERNNNNIFIESNAVNLSTNLQSNFRFSAGLKENNVIYDYVTDDYEKTITTSLYSGKTELSDYSIKVYVITDNGNVLLTDNEYITIHQKDFVLDMRFISKLPLYVDFIYNDVSVGNSQLTVKRKDVSFDTELTGTVSVRESDQSVKYTVSVFHGGAQLTSPENYVQIKWSTDSDTQTDVIQGYGKEVLIDLEKTGMGNTVNSYVDVKCDVHPLAESKILSDEEGNELTDDNGNYLF